MSHWTAEIELIVKEFRRKSEATTHWSSAHRIYKEKFSQTHVDIDKVAEMMIQDGKRRNYSPRTIETYNHALNKFFRIYRVDPRNIKRNDLEKYVDQMIKWNQSTSTINVHVSALKYFYQKVLKKNCSVHVPIGKYRKRIPTFLEIDETVALLNAIENKKHKLMISLLYSSGMRVSELLHLKVKELDINNGQGWVRRGKGNKDRPFVIAEKLKNDLQVWIENSRLDQEDYLFSNPKNKIMSGSTVRVILKKAAGKAEIKKNVHPHTLRHSFATHLAVNGYSATDIQSILGHQNLETTMVYTHIAKLKMLNIKSPYDQLQQL